MKPDTLYQLLPAIYRQQDVVQGETLRALMGILQSALQNLQNDVDTNYNNCFIETCELWAIPYIADLLGITGMDNQLMTVVNQRSRVANTIRYRRRKGQAAITEQVTNSVTGWSSRLVEFFQYLSVTQHMKHIRPGRGTTAAIRDVDSMAALNGPFDITAHTAEVCGSSRQLKYNIPIVGLFIWRLQNNGILQSTPFAVDPINKPGCYTFNPLGLDMPLFNLPQPLTSITQRVTKLNIPVAIPLTAMQQNLADYYGNNRSIYLTDPSNPQWGDHSNIIALDLSQWTRPPEDKIAIDPQLGRIRLGANIKTPQELEVSYQFGFGANIGGGSYDRHAQLASADAEILILTVSKKKMTLANGDLDSNNYRTLNDAYSAWQISQKQHAIIQILDSGVYQETIQWRIDSSSAAGSLIIQAADGVRPCLICVDDKHLPIEATFIAQKNTSQLQINGLLTYAIVYLQGDMQFNLSDSTLVPAPGYPSIITTSNNTQLMVTIHNSIVGAIRLPSSAKSLQIFNSIIDAGQAKDGHNTVAIAADDSATKPGPSLHIERSTVSGNVHVTKIETISEAILVNTINADDTTSGCVRYSYLPLDSNTPPRYRCQPELSYIPFATERAAELKVNTLDDLPEPQRGLEEDVILNTLLPVFISMSYGDPNYMQLSLNCSQGITSGAQDGSEMGAYQALEQPKRALNLAHILNEFLPFGLQKDIFYSDAKAYHRKG